MIITRIIRIEVVLCLLLLLLLLVVLLLNVVVIFRIVVLGDIVFSCGQSMFTWRILEASVVFLSSANEVSTGPTCQFLCVCLSVCLFVCLSFRSFFQGV